MSAAVSSVARTPDRALQLARALGLLALAEALRAERERQCRDADERLGRATQEAVEALDALEAAGVTVLEAAALVVALREGRR